MPCQSRDIVEVMEKNDIESMFVFTVAMGIVTFFMAWIIVVIAIKGWALGKENKTRVMGTWHDFRAIQG